MVAWSSSGGGPLNHPAHSQEFSPVRSLARVVTQMYGPLGASLSQSGPPCGRMFWKIPSSVSQRSGAHQRAAVSNRGNPHRSAALTILSNLLVVLVWFLYCQSSGPSARCQKRDPVFTRPRLSRPCGWLYCLELYLVLRRLPLTVGLLPFDGCPAPSASEALSV